MRVLGIETSCDETAVAVVETTKPAPQPVGIILANVVYSQLTEHRRFGGVVPEIAARAISEHIDGLVEESLRAAGLDLADLDGIAATGGPGLIGGVMVGVMTAKALAFAHEKPFVAVNHLGATLSARLTGTWRFLFAAAGVGWSLPASHRARPRRFHAWERPSTTPSANASTRRRSSWGWAFPAGRPSNASAAEGNPTASACRGRCGANQL